MTRHQNDRFRHDSKSEELGLSKCLSGYQDNEARTHQAMH
jgi:hypothetical protein